MRRRLSFALLLALFVAAFVWRIAWLPYRTEALYRAVPRQALFVSEHAALAARWTLWRTHPLVCGVVRGLGVPAADWTQLANAPGTREILARFAARHTLTAYVPALGWHGEPAWVVVSWAGFQAQLLRWGFYRASLTDLAPCTFRNGRQGWRFVDRHQALGGQSLAFAVSEGVLLGTLSRDPDAVCALVEQIEHHVAGPPVLAEIPFAADGTGAASDRVFYGDLAVAPADGTGAGLWRADFALAADGRATGTVTLPAWPVAGGETAPAVLTCLGGLLRDGPGILALGPVDALGDGERMGKAGPAVQLLWDGLRGVVSDGARGFVALTQPAYSGRIMGFKAATLLLGIEVASPATAETTIGEALDRFNATFRTTLIRRGLPPEAPEVMTVESVRRGPLSYLGADEQVCYVITNGWLVAASSSGVLRELLTPAAGTASPDWARELAAQRAQTLLWLDARATAESLSKVVAMLDLLCLAEGRDGELGRVRQMLAQAQAWLIDFQALGRLRLWARPGNGDGAAAQIAFELGARAGGGP